MSATPITVGETAIRPGCSIAASAMELDLHVNGAACRLRVPANELLLECLRQRLGLTGVKRGCDDSSCGACAVLVNGRAVLSCTLLAASCAGHEPAAEITTIEGLRRDGRLTRLQRAFGELGGAQCGFCTPGMIVSATALLNLNPHPDQAAIRAALAGNLCRCTGYMQIVAAVAAAIAAPDAAEFESEGEAVR